MSEKIVNASQLASLTGWLFLFIAIILEVCGTVSMKLAAGFTKPLPSALMFLFYGLCLVSLEFAVSKIELNVVYAVWSGIGTALVALVAAFYFQEQITLLKLASMGLIIAGVIGLNVRS